MNHIKYDLIKKDKDDIDNFLLYQITSENKYISKSIYNTFINIPPINNKQIRSKIRTVFQNNINALGREYNIPFPYNLSTPVLRPYYDDTFFNDITFYRMEYKRVYNWIKTAVLHYPFLKSFITNTQSCNGQNSPHTRINLWALSLIGSPAKVNHLLKRLFFHSKSFIELFDNNFNPSHRIIANCINQKLYNIQSLDTIKIKFTKIDAVQIAVTTLMKYHPFIAKIDDSNLTNINRIFLGGLVTILTEDELHSVRYCHEIFIPYSKCMDILTLLYKIKNNDIAELALMVI